MNSTITGLLSSSAFAVLLLLPATASADVPPPDDFVESCTVEGAQQRTGNSCELCSRVNHGERDLCTKKFAATSTMAHECKTYGASVWDEVWCDSAKPRPPAEVQADAPAREQAEKQGEAPAEAAPAKQADAQAEGSKGCGCVSSGEPARGEGLLALALGLGLLGLGRRQGAERAA